MISSHRRQAGLARALLSKDELARYIQRRPWIVYVDLALIYVAVVAAFGLLALADAWWMYGLAFVVIGTRQHALFIMGHDGIHRGLHPNRRVNDALANWLCEAPLGVCLDDRRPNHMGHHRLLGSEDDPDRHIHIASNKTDFVKFVLFLSGARTVHKYFLKMMPFADHRGGKGSGSLGEYLRHHIPVAVVQLAIIAAITLTMPWWYYPVFWLLPIFALVFIPDEIRGFSEHAHPVLPDSAVDDRRLITFVPTELEAMFLSPRNMNYHAEHHLWPYIPYYNLPAVHALVRRRPANTTLVRRSYLLFLAQWFWAMPLRAPQVTAKAVATAPADWSGVDTAHSLAEPRGLRPKPATHHTVRSTSEKSPAQL